jgi:16S rRNA (cytosine967-C5)-methyltransferase
MKLHPNITASIIVALKNIFIEGKHADDIVRNLLQSNPKWGSRDRRFIASTIYTIVRWWRRYLFIAKTNLQEDACVEKVLSVYLYESFGSDLETPLPIAINVAQFNEQVAQALLIRSLKHSIPDWMDERCVAELGETVWGNELTLLNKEADVFIRVNTLKCNPKQLIDILQKEGVIANAFGNFAETLKLEERKPLQRLISFLNGMYEVQDVGSQTIAHYLNPSPNAYVIDACAGAGGKSLHIAALMKNKGRILSMDIESSKLKELERRAIRAGVATIKTKTITEGTITSQKNSADYLLLDLPCSGIGVLRRNPDDKWKLSKGRMDALLKIQQKILQEYSLMLKPGGVLVYATCSILPSENDKQIDAFLAVNNQFELEKKQTIYPSQGGDGYFMARLIRKQ